MRSVCPLRVLVRGRLNEAGWGDCQEEINTQKVREGVGFPKIRPHYAYTMLATGFFQNSIRYVCIDFRSVPLKPLNLYTLQNANFKSSDVTTVPFAEASFP